MATSTRYNNYHYIHKKLNAHLNIESTSYLLLDITSKDITSKDYYRMCFVLGSYNGKYVFTGRAKKTNHLQLAEPVCALHHTLVQLFSIQGNLLGTRDMSILDSD